MQERYNADSQDSRMYQRWNATTATCYHYHMICKNCPNEWACKMGDNFNQYHIKQVKYSTLMTYRNLGKQGLKRYIESEEV